MVHGNTVPAAQAAIRDRDTVKVKVSFALGLRTPRVGRVGIEYRLPVADAWWKFKAQLKFTALRNVKYTPHFQQTNS